MLVWPGISTAWTKMSTSALGVMRGATKIIPSKRRGYLLSIIRLIKGKTILAIK